MATKLVYLEGSSPEATLCPVDIERLETLDKLKDHIASIFSVAEAGSISFHSESGLLTSIDEINRTVAKIGVRVDNQVIREPHGPRELPFVGNYFEIHPDHIGNHERLFHRYGNVIKTVVMGRTVYLTNDPRVAKVVFGENEFFTKMPSDFNHPLFSMNNNVALFIGDTTSPAFKLAHKFIPPSMSTNAAQRYMPILQNAVQDSFTVFDQLDGRQAAWNTYQYMLKLSGQVMTKVVLGMDVDHFDTVDTQLHEIVRLIGDYVLLGRTSSLSLPCLKYLPFSSARRLSVTTHRLISLLDQAAAAWPLPGAPDLPIPKAAVQSTCITDYLKRAVDEKNEKLPHEYLIPNIAVVLAAGISTTSSMLSYILYLLARYPDTQTKIFQEVVDNNVTPTTPWAYDTLMSLPYLDHFVKEALRLHGPAFQPARNAKKDVIVPGAYRIPAGAVVNPLFSSLHRNGDYWDNPGRFDPDRWMAADVKKHRMAYTPFAAGPRGCVGFNIAHLELRLVVALLVYRYEFVDVSAEPMRYDPEYLLDRLMNCYVRAIKRTTRPGKEL
ncbi:Cytochrome P450 3A25 [Talaromyces islandicus]|uniref:Cytochrome P450 3A25 n=1 Tax=Talaromyces islandicus TaxID=28573 RepID=A0A0U1LTD2_TALIS|nr:Cytochrome P450 3A25 [Talaromyces islandicus]